jgi:hypothetical protein
MNYINHINYIIYINYINDIKYINLQSLYDYINNMNYIHTLAAYIHQLLTYIHIYIALHCITLHYITLHTYIDVYTYITTCHSPPAAFGFPSDLQGAKEHHESCGHVLKNCWFNVVNPMSETIYTQNHEFYGSQWSPNSGFFALGHPH